MEDDIGLLRKAAEAAGYEEFGYSNNFGDFSLGEPYSANEVRWNPLKDDTDAFRLMVKLHLDVMTCSQQRGEIQVGGAVSATIFQPVGDDPDAATRRAIVRAAASTVDD